jgi:NAD(P)-dependent dehydrogenase (short-subunit alcohol dehydrogenase family)
MSSENRFVGRVALITGGAKGIGKAVAVRLKSEGAIVCVCGRDDDALEEMAREGFHAFKTDVSDAKQIVELIGTLRSRFGTIDICVNNAAIYPQVKLLDMTENDWDTTMQINLKSVFLLSRETAVCMIETKTRGVILNAASFAALIPSAGSAAYAASKAAVYSLTRSFAAELAPYGIRVNGYIPGVIETPLTQSVIKAKAAALTAQIAMQRIGSPDEAANAVVFLASDEASYITGTFLEISGGKLCVQNPAAAWS